MPMSQKAASTKIRSLRQSAPYSGKIGSRTHSNNELTSLFECLICFEYALPPIYQCDSGHIVCAGCWPQLKTCPTCRSTVVNIRNLALEKVAEQVDFLCKFTGCTALMTAVEKLKHEKTCEFRPYICPCPGTMCKWSGSVSDVLQHLSTQHHEITTLQGQDIVFMATDIALLGNVDWVMLQSCFGANFLLVLEKQESTHNNMQIFFAIVQLIGTSKQADNFAYRLEVKKGHRRLAWEGTPHSIHAGIQSIVNTGDCLMFNSHTAALFADNGNIAINVTIGQC